MFWASLLAIIAFGLIHSVLAAIGIKYRFRAAFGDRAYEGFYRLIYNILSIITFVPVMLLIVLSPSTILWQVPAPWAAVFRGIQLVGLFALTAAVLQADPLRFVGVRQALAFWQAKPLPLPPEPLQVGGFYGLVRHPLYLFSLLVLWPTPVMTDAFLGFTVGSTVYFIIGSRLEEKRLTGE